MDKKSGLKNTDSDQIRVLRNRLIKTAENQDGLFRMLENIQQIKEDYRKVFDLVPEAVFEVDLEFNYVYVNQKTLQLTGYPKEYFLNSAKVYDLIVPEEKDKLLSDLNRLIDGKKIINDLYTMIAKDGSKLDLIVHVGPVYDNGLVVGIRGVATDVTEKLAIKQELKKEKQLLRSILDTANSIIICLDSKANILIFNDECERISGYKRAEVLGKSWPEIFVPVEYRWPAEYTFAEWIRLHPRSRYESPLKTKAGELRNIFWSNSTILADNSAELMAIAVGFDVTDLKQTRAALYESEIKYRMLLEQSSDAIYFISKSRFIFVNDRFVDMFGYSRQELLDPEFSYMVLVSPESKPLIEGRLAMIARGELPPNRYQYTALKKDGTRIYLDVSLSYIQIESRNIVQGVYRDISNQKKAEDKLSRALSDLNQVFNATTPMVVIDKDHSILKVNQPYLKLFKVSESEITGKKCDHLYYSKMCESDDCPIKRLLDGGGIYEYENTTILKDGTEIISLVTASPYFNIDGGVQGIVESYVDITRRNHAEKALRESEARYRAVWESSPMAICLTDSEAVYRYVNPAYCSLYGFTEAELVGRNYIDLIVPPEKRKIPPGEYLIKFMKGIPTPLGETEFMRKDGSLIWVQYKSDFVRVDGKPVLKVTMNVDHTDRKVAEKNLVDSRMQFKAQFKASPIPTYTWQKKEDDFILLDYNNAALDITDGKIAEFVGIKLSRLYRDEPNIIEEIVRCYREKTTFEKEYYYRYRSTKKVKYLAVGITYAPPDLVIVHTEDITKQREQEIHTAARLNLLRNLRNASTIDECLQLGCEAISAASLFGRSVLTLHNESREIINLGQSGLSPEIVEAARGAPAPDIETTKKMLQEEFRISNSYFIPIESGLELTRQPRHIPQGGADDVGDLSWQDGDELFVPIINDQGKIIGWLSVDTPINGKRPDKNIIENLEEIVAIVMKKVQSLENLFELNAEKKMLEERTVALKELLTFIQNERQSYKKRISDTVEQILLPNLERTRRRDGSIDEVYHKMLKKNLKQLGGSMGSEISIYAKLSARESEICQMIKVGSTSKSIANKLHITVGTVQKHREKIRKKLGIAKKNINLATYLKNL